MSSSLQRAFFLDHQNRPEEWKNLHTQSDLDQIHALGDELTATLARTDDSDEQDIRLKFMIENVSSMPDSNDSTSEFEVPLPSGERFGMRASFVQTCSDFANAVYWYIFRRYIGSEGRRWLWAGLFAADFHEEQERVRLFAGALGLWHGSRGHQQDALAYHEQSLHAARAQGDQINEATALNNIGLVWDILGEKRKALAYYEQALPLYEALRDQDGEGTALNNIGAVWGDLGGKRKALKYLEQALPLRRAMGDRGGEATTPEQHR